MIVLQATKHFDYANHLATRKYGHRIKARQSYASFHNILGKEILASKKSMGVKQINDDVLTDAVIKFYSKSNHYYHPDKVVMAGVKMSNHFNYYQEFGVHPARSVKLFDTGSKLFGVLKDLKIVSGGQNVLEDIGEGFTDLIDRGEDQLMSFTLQPEFEIFEGVVGIIFGIAPIFKILQPLIAGALGATTVVGLIRATSGYLKHARRLKKYEALVDKDQLREREAVAEKIIEILADYKGKKVDELPSDLKKDIDQFFTEEDMVAREYGDMVSKVERDYKKIGVLKKLAEKVEKKNKLKKEKK